MTFDQSVQAFLTYCELERALSPDTVIAYRNDLKHFAAFATPSLGTPFSPIQVDRALVRGFIAEQRGRGLAVPTIQRRVHCLRSFWSFLVHTGIETRESPLDGIRLPKKEHRVAAYLNEGEMKAILEAAGRGGNAQLRCATMRWSPRSCLPGCGARS